MLATLLLLALNLAGAADISRQWRCAVTAVQGKPPALIVRVPVTVIP
jgi:hypothetical protein